MSAHAITERSEANQEQRAYCLQLAEQVLSKARIYLDTSYWVRLRDCALGREADPRFGDLLNALESLVDHDMAVCPIDATGAIEVLRQQDPATMWSTAALMDRVAKRVCIVPRPERERIEVLHFLYKYAFPEKALIPPKQLVWTRPGSVFGELVPENEAWTPDQRRLIQIGIQQALRNLGMVEVLETMGPGAPSMRRDTSAEADAFNKGKRAHAHELRSFKKAWLAELRGGLDAMAETIHGAFAHVYARTTRDTVPPPDFSDSDDMRLFRKIVVEAFRKGSVTTDLPCVNVPATLHAAIRWDTHGPYQSGDWGDIAHATAALPYCNLFLTDKRMASLIRGRRLDTLYDCAVVAGVDDALKAVLLLSVDAGARQE